MKPYPHHYTVEASASREGSVTLSGEGLPTIVSAPPAEFDGPGDHWSPETLFVAAVADCFVLTFRAVARASGFAWEELSCRASGTLDRADGPARFVAFTLETDLRMSPGGRRDAAVRLLEKAERGCLVSNSLAAPVELRVTVA